MGSLAPELKRLACLAILVVGCGRSGMDDSANADAGPVDGLDARAAGDAGTGALDTGTPADVDAGPDAPDTEHPSDGATVDAPVAHPLTVTQVAVGERHTCVLLSDGSVKCWGGNQDGQLGYGNTVNIGDDELPSSVGLVSLSTTPGVVATAIVAGELHTCALLSDGTAKCWGANVAGQLGYGHTRTIGDDELPSSVGPVSVTTLPGVTVTALTAGWSHTCALLSNGTVTCWGSYGTGGGIGYGNTRAVGDDELPSSVGPVSVTTKPGITVAAIGGGAFHTCARLTDGSLTCWGRNTLGDLGYGNTNAVGDDELPSSVGSVSVTTTPGAVVTGLAGGVAHTCARLSDGTARCWGTQGNSYPSYGSGYGNTDAIGDDELPSSVGPLSLTTAPGVTVDAVSGGFTHTCALLSDGSVVCWGGAFDGQLGHGNKTTVGDDELPSSAGPVSLTTRPGVKAVGLATGTTNYHTCAILSDGGVTCWGFNSDGELGQGHTRQIGDDEVPSSLPSVALF